MNPKLAGRCGTYNRSFSSSTSIQAPVQNSVSCLTITSFLVLVAFYFSLFFFLFFFFLGGAGRVGESSRSSINISKNKLHSNFKEECSQIGQKVCNEPPEYFDSGTDSPESCLLGAAISPFWKRGDEQNMRSVTDSYTCKRTNSLAFLPLWNNAEKNNPNKQHKENYFVLHKFSYGEEDLHTRKIFVHAAGTELFKKSTEALSFLCLCLPKTWLAHWYAKHGHSPKRVTTHLPREKEQCQNDIIPFLVCYKLNYSGQLRGP